MKKNLAFLFFLYSIAGIAQHKLETVIQKGHGAALTSLKADSSNTFLVTGSRDKTAKLWSIQTGKEIRTFVGHDKTVSGVDISVDLKLVATASADGSAMVWEVSTGKIIFSTGQTNFPIEDVKFTADGKHVVTGGYSDTVTVWNLETKKAAATFAVNPDRGLGNGVTLNFSPDGKWLAIGEDNKKVSLVEVSTWEVKLSLTLKEGYCGGCAAFTAFSPDSKYLLKVSGHSPIEEYEISSGKLIRSIGEDFDEVTGIAYAGDSIVAGNETELLVYNRAGMLVKKEVITEGQNLSGLQVSGKSIFISSEDNKAYVYDLTLLTRIKTLEGVLNNRDKDNIKYDINNYWDSHIAKYIQLKNELLLTNDSRSILKGKTSTEVKFWDIATGVVVREFTGHETAVLCFDKSGDEKILVTADAGGKAKIWSSEGEKIFELNGHREPILAAKLSPDETQIALSSWDATLSIWDVKTGKKINHLDFNNSSAYSVSYTPDGLYLITGRLGKSLDMWEPDSRTHVKTFIGHTDVVSCIQFHPTQKNIMISSSWDGSVRAWDITTGLMVKKIKTTSPVHACLFSPDGKSIITAGNDRKIRIWNYETGEALHVLEGHQAEVTNLKLGQDGKMLVSAAVDGVIKFWNFDKKQEFYEHLNVGKNDWMVRTTEGYFNGTFGALDYIHFVKGTEVIKADQVFEKFYRPNLLPEIFKKQGATGQIRSIEDVYQSSPPPSFKIATIPVEGKAEVQVYLKVTDMGGGVDEVKLTQNGKRIELDKANIKIPAKKGEHAVILQNVSLVHGLNIFEVSGFSKERLESSPVGVEVISDKGDLNSTCHVLVIGIDKYINPSLELTYARKDAEAFADLMKGKGKNIFKEVKIHALYDGKAGKENILELLRELSIEVRKNDVFIFYYAGHGSMHEDNFYFIPVDCSRLYDAQGLSKEAIQASILQEKLRDIKALKQIIIMDACHSGGSVELLASRGAVEEKAIAQLSRSAGIHVLASAGEEQTAKEIAELKHGLFTYVLLNGLNGAADGSPKDGKITVYEIKSYLDDQTPELNKKYSGKPQYPFTFSRGHDFPVVVED